MKIERVSMEHLKPSSPTPPHLKDFKLSFIDEMIPNSYIPLILYYSFDELDPETTSYRLKKSLSEALVKFYPLAGRMKGQSSVDCNDDGILYIEAKVPGQISDVIYHPELGFSDNFIPFRSNGNFSNARELLAVQVNLFSCGGVAIGICISHRISDFSTLTSFVKYWCWCSISCDNNSPYSLLVCDPLFNSASLFPPRNTPDFKPNSTSLSVMPPVLTKLVTKRVVFNASGIEALKLQVKEKSSIAKPTRVEVISAFLWKQCLLAKGVDDKSSVISVAFHPVNLRGRISELKEHSFGNLFQMMSAVNVGESDWIEMVEKMRDAMGETQTNHIPRLVGEKGFELSKENLQMIGKLMALEDNVQVFRFASYCRFRAVYEADFGWGKPLWMSIASYASKDTVLLFDSIQLPGGIEAWITMADKDMERLQNQMDYFIY